MQYAVQAENLKVVRGTTDALNDVSFVVVPGKITGLIGPSGSGKTTLMRAMIGVQKITSGSLSVLGLPAGSKALRPQIGYVSQAPAVYMDVTTRQNIVYFAKMLGLAGSEVDRVIHEVDLVPQANQMVGSLSGGQVSRVSLAVALLGNSPLLVLDEPTVGLDPVLRQRLWKLFAKLAAEGRTLLISSHVMDEAERCNELLLIREGKVLSHGTRDALLQETKTDSVEDAFLKLAGGIDER